MPLFWYQGKYEEKELFAWNSVQPFPFEMSPTEKK